MAGVSIGSVYSFLYAQIWRQTDAGLPTGQLDPASLVNDTTSHAYLLTGIEGTLPEYSYGNVSFRDGNVLRGNVETGLESLTNGTITLNTYDATLNTLLVGGNVDTTSIVNATISSTNAGQNVPYTIGIMLTMKQFSRVPATWGHTKFLTLVYPSCTARYTPPSVNQSSGENPMTGSLVFTPREGSKFPTGNAFSSTQGWKNNRTFEYFISADYPYALSMYVQDGTETDYIVGYLPVSSTVTSGNTTNLFTINGTVTAPTSISTSTGVVVKAAAGTAGQIAAALYQTAFAPIP